MAKARPNVYLHPEADATLVRLQNELPLEGLSPQTRRQDIVSALILYTSRQQAAGMISAFLRARAEEDGAQSEAGNDGC